MDILIRKADKTDIPVLCTLYHKFYQYNASLQPNYCLPAFETGNYPESVVARNTGEIFLAECNGIVAGFIHLESNSTPPYPSVSPHRFCMVVDLYVLEKYQHKGIGKELMDAAKQWKDENNLEYLELMVLSNNPKAIDFYKKEGLVVSSLTMRLE